MKILKECFLRLCSVHGKRHFTFYEKKYILYVIATTLNNLCECCSEVLRSSALVK
jgi:hypothetical protein